MSNSSEKKTLIRAIPVANALKICFDYVEINNSLRGFISGNNKLDSTAFTDVSGDYDKLFANNNNFMLSVSELYDLAFLGLYETEVAKKVGDKVEYLVGTDIENQIAKNNELREKQFCDGVLVIQRPEEESGFFPIQHVKVISFTEMKGSIEDLVISAVLKKVKKRANYPSICGLVVSIISDESGVNYKKITNAVKNKLNFDAFYFIEHHDSMKSATIISIDTSTMEFIRNPITIKPSLVNE